MRKLFILLLIAALLGCLFNNRDGYHNYATAVISSEQPNDVYLQWLLKGYGYEGKRVVDPDYNMQESTRLNKMLSMNNYYSQPATPTLFLY